MNCEKVPVQTPFIKLDSFLKFAGATETGGHAKLIVADGLCKVDGEVCTQRGRKLYPGMKVEVEAGEGNEGGCYEVMGSGG